MEEATGNELLKEIEELLQDTSMEDLEETAGNTNEFNNLSSTPNGAIPNTEFSLDKVSLIRSAIDKTEDIESLRDLCNGGIPDEIRAEVWQAVLGVKRRPDAIGTWDGPLDCDNQVLIHSDCLDQAKLITADSDEGKMHEQTAAMLEEVITFYCKSRNVTYTEDCGWVELIRPLAALNFVKGDLFNCLYVLLAKYIPRDCRAGGRPFDLFRLLLLYHDPELCSILDTRKLLPHMYLQPWLRSLFASQCSTDVIHSLWDLYFIEHDPFFVFFLALVMVINAKELVLDSNTSSVDELNALIVSLPQQLTSDDINDLFSLAQYYAVRTPQSFRKDYYNALYGNVRSATPISTGILCLSVQVQEVIDSLSHDFNNGIKYFVIDCRPLHQFSIGHLHGAMHLDTDLLLHSPTDFSTAMNRLCDKVKQMGGDTGSHLCFLGSGREQEDQYMNMALAKFLQQSIPYVSIVRGGYLELWRVMGGKTEQLLEDYDPVQCQRLYNESRNDIIPSPSRRSDNSDSDTEAGYYKQRIQVKSSQLYASLAAGWRDKSQRFRVRMGEMWKNRQIAAYKDRPLRAEEKKSGKRYHNLPEKVFVIADDDDEGDENGDISSEDDSSNPLVNITLYSTSPEVVHSFPCSEAIENNRLLPSHLLLTNTDLIVLRETPDRAGWGRVKHRENLNSILKITAKKHHPDVITFKYGYYDNEMPILTHCLRLHIPNTRRATETIKHHIIKCTKSNS